MEGTMFTGTGVDMDDRGLLVSCSHCGRKNRLAFERLNQTFRCAGCHFNLELPTQPIEAHSSENFRAMITRAPLPTLIDFWAPWCGPCKMVAPEIAKVAQTSNGAYLVLKVNTEEMPVLAHQFRISSIPTLVVVRNGEEVARKSGAMPATAIRQFLSQFSG